MKRHSILRNTIALLSPSPSHRLFSVVVHLGLLALPSLAQTIVEIGPVTYEVGPTSVTIKDCDTNATGDLLLPNTVDGKPVTVVGDSAFESCESLTAITLPDGITHIETDAFYECAEVVSIDLPEGLVSIGDYSFSYCYKMTSLRFPASLTTVGEWFLADSDSLQNIEVDPANPNFTTVDGVLYTKNLETLIVTPSGFTGVLKVPAATTTITAHGCRYCPGLEAVILPDGLLTIEGSAFSDLPLLRSIDIPDSVTTIGSGGFSRTGLTRVTLGEGLTSIGSSAFRRSSDLQEVTFRGHAPTLAAQVFEFTHPDIVFHVRYGATGFESGFFVGQSIDYGLNILSVARDGSGNVTITTDAFDLTDTTFKHSEDLATPFGIVTGASIVGGNALMIPSGNPAAAGSRHFYFVEFNSDGPFDEEEEEG